MITTPSTTPCLREARTVPELNHKEQGWNGGKGEGKVEEGGGGAFSPAFIDGPLPVPASGPVACPPSP